MVNELEVLNFTNTIARSLEIWIEPEAEAIELLPGKTAQIFIKQLDVVFKPIDISFETERIVVFREMSTEMKIYIDSELKFYSSMS